MHWVLGRVKANHHSPRGRRLDEAKCHLRTSGVVSNPAWQGRQGTHECQCNTTTRNSSRRHLMNLAASLSSLRSLPTFHTSHIGATFHAFTVAKCPYDCLVESLGLGKTKRDIYWGYNSRHASIQLHCNYSVRIN